MSNFERRYPAHPQVEAAAQGLVAVCSERTRSVVEFEARPQRERHHVGAIEMPVRDDRDRAGFCQPSECLGMGQVGVRDEHMAWAVVVVARGSFKFCDGSGEGRIQALGLDPQHICADGTGPTGYLVVVADDLHGQ